MQELDTRAANLPSVKWELCILSVRSLPGVRKRGRTSQGR